MRRPRPYSIGETLLLSRDVPIYRRIADALVRDIEAGTLQPGTYLPSSRALAKILGVNRKVVVTAYATLIAQGWLVAASTSGTMVSPSPEAR